MGAKDPKGYYAILGLALDASAVDIKDAFRRRAMELHPDRNKSPDATARFQLLNEAYAVLGDPAARAQYDTISIEAGEDAAAAEEPPEPIVCSACGKVTAQPRYAIFYVVKSYIFATSRSAIQGIFCSACAEKKAFKASALTWLLGWWGFPYGPIWSIHALFHNMIGGIRPPNINARLAAHQAWVFATQGRVEMARAVALDALALVKKVKPDQVTAKMRRARGYEVDDEGAKLQEQIGKLLQVLGEAPGGIRLRDAWSLLRRPFFAQAAVGLGVLGYLGYLVATAPPSQPPRGPKPYAASVPHAASARPTYVRPATAPNGEPWPTHAAYVPGYPQDKTDGLSTVTIDNSQNDSDVFVKVVSLDGPNAVPVRSIFIPAHSSFTAKHLAPGPYDVRYRDLDSGHLWRSGQFTLEEITESDGTRYSEMTLTLYKVSHGNMQVYDLAEDEF